MKTDWKSFFLRWGINTVAVFVAARFSGIHYEKLLDLIVAALILGILNSFFRPLRLLTMILTLGVLTLIINASILWFVSAIMKPHFYVDGFGSAVWGAFLISLVSIILNIITGANSSVKVNRGGGGNPTPPAPPRRDIGGGGPIIDV